MQRLHSYDEKTVNFSKIDDHANQATHADSKTFDDLIDYLNRILQNGGSTNSKLLLARGLLAWIGHAQTNLDVNAPFNTPMNLVLDMVRGRVSHAQVFKTFCGYANIDCRIVTGRAKAIRYRAGDGDSQYLQNHSWNIFTTEGQQHLVHPGWAVHAIVGYSHGGEFVVEKDGKNKLHMKTEQTGRSQYVFNDFWFCTHPKIFVTRCYPNSPQDQLLSAGETINNVDAFLALPDLRQAFYMSDLSLMTEKSCRLKTNKGMCQIHLLANRTTCKPSSLNFSYELTIVDTGQAASSFKAEDLPRLVLFTRNQDVYEFEIRFPVTGEYRFTLTLHFEDRENRCCEFKINCTEASKNCKKLPFDSGIEGFGFGTSATEAGLKNPSQPGGKVYIEPSTSKKGKNCQNKKLKYQVDEDHVHKTEFSTEVFSVDGKGNIVTHPGKSKTVVDPATCSMCIDLSIVEPGEYALKINSKQKGKGQTTEVARYMLSTDKEVHDSQRRIKLKKREVKKENKKSEKEDEKRTLLEEYESLQTELEDNNLLGEIYITMDNHVMQQIQKIFNNLVNTGPI